MAYHELLKSTCTINSVVVSEDGYGQPTETVSVKAIDVKTRRTPMTNSDPQTIGDYPVTSEYYKFYFLPDQDIALTDKIILGQYVDIFTKPDLAGFLYKLTTQESTTPKILSVTGSIDGTLSQLSRAIVENTLNEQEDWFFALSPPYDQRQDITVVYVYNEPFFEYEVQFVTTDSSERVKTVYAKIVKYG